MRSLLGSIMDRVRNQQNRTLFQIPVEANRAAVCFCSDELVAVAQQAAQQEETRPVGEALATCPAGETQALLDAHPDLLDAELVVLLGQQAGLYQVSGQPGLAQRLFALAQGLGQSLGLTPPPPPAPVPP